jgi:uncharacterized protein
MDFRRYTIALLQLRDDAPSLTKEQKDALQDAHMAHLSVLHERGELLVAGPTLGSPDRRLRGLGIYAANAVRARELADEDPAVRAGRYDHDFQTWLVPARLISFTAGRLPASMAEATGALLPSPADPKHDEPCSRDVITPRG